VAALEAAKGIDTAAKLNQLEEEKATENEAL